MPLIDHSGRGPFTREVSSTLAVSSTTVIVMVAM
jgi:hypothetical protein